MVKLLSPVRMNHPEQTMLSRSGDESEFLRGVQQMGILAECPLTFRKAENMAERK